MSVKTDLRFLLVLDKHAFPREATSKYSFCKRFALLALFWQNVNQTCIFTDTYTYAREIVLKNNLISAMKLLKIGF